MRIGDYSLQMLSAKYFKGFFTIIAFIARKNSSGRIAGLRDQPLKLNATRSSVFTSAK